ncbi:hypothetical protein P154DRAFT_578583 [Amniculicola lignicola CBS 123094]|uniref:Uncharacterized protein n=1 Tax=Amniculicola lignicola CBS 123094 TaxID=1392246 RepID=A0A6A5WAN9_9PLEO|nr:hypothetical protein P154DRAFT_578583 [Amniculicola lignicola CBS 123094]
MPPFSSILRAFEPLLMQNREAVFEGDIFSVLFEVVDVLRSIEFALADGAINVGKRPMHSLSESHADRFWSITEAARDDPVAIPLVYFDVKSTVARVGSKQIFRTNTDQQSRRAAHTSERPIQASGPYKRAAHLQALRDASTYFYNGSTNNSSDALQ